MARRLVRTQAPATFAAFVLLCAGAGPLKGPATQSVILQALEPERLAKYGSRPADAVTLILGFVPFSVAMPVWAVKPK